CHRDQGADRRSTDLRLPAHPCAAPASAPRTGRYDSERQAGLPGHESAPSSARPPHRERRGTEHEGRIAVDRPDARWCSDGFEIGCDNGEKVRIAFTLDCCDREAISWVATTGGIDSSDIRDLMVESVERRFGLVGKLPQPIEW